MLIDFETRSRADLQAHGAYLYAQDLSTQVLMMAYQLPPTSVCPTQTQVWMPPMPFPEEVSQYVRDGGKIWAWNAAFDRLIWEYIIGDDYPMVPVPRGSQWACASAWARANGLPGKLTRAAEMVYGVNDPAADIKHRGGALIRRFSLPTFNGSFADPTAYPDEWIEFCRYCAYDVAIMKSLIDQCGQPSDAWYQEYTTNEQINDRGLKIDRAFANTATAWKLVEQMHAKDTISALTGGLRTLSGRKIITWVFEHLFDDPAHELMHADTVSGLTLDAATRTALLDTETGIQDATVRAVVQAIDNAQASSVSKYKTMTDRADPEDDRVRGAFIFEGAGVTGRYASGGVQVHNLSRDKPDDVDATHEAFMDPSGLHILQGQHSAAILRASGKATISKALRSMLRPTIMAADGHTFVCGDWAQIEGRVNPWLTNDPDAAARLAAYADPTRDIYSETAEGILGRKCDTDERQTHGKIPELALGYGGGVNAFQHMAVAYGVDIPEAKAKQIVTNWRATQAWAPRWWKALEMGAVSAVRYPRQRFDCGRVNMIYTPGFDGTLRITLPSERTLNYPYARIELNRFDQQCVTFARGAFHPKRGEAWPRRSLWGGLICENITQAVSADILRRALERVQAAGCGRYIVGHTHDEILMEVPTDHADMYRETLQHLMQQSPMWASSLPLAVEVWTGARYRK